MQTLHKVIYTKSRKDTVKLYYLTDLHIGARACDEARLRSKISEIENDPAAYWIGGGDYVDAICRLGDKRHHEEALAPWLWGSSYVMKQQQVYACEMLKPIANKCLGLIEGNHEQAARRFYDYPLYDDIVSAIARDADCDPFDLKLGVNGFVVLKFRRKYAKGKKYGGTSKMVVYCHHGYGGGRLPGGDALALHHILGDVSCDIALLGHRHKQHAIMRQFISPGAHGKGGKVRTAQAAFCGHYLNAWIKPSNDKALVDTYVERIGLPPAPLGTPTIEIKPDVKQVSITLEMNVGYHTISHTGDLRLKKAA